jgi:hypothetical protein
MIAAIIGDTGNATRYGDLADATATTFRRLFYDAGTGTVGNGTLTQQLYGLGLGLLAADGQQALVAKRVADLIVANGTALYAGAFGTWIA